MKKTSIFLSILLIFGVTACSLFGNSTQPGGEITSLPTEGAPLETTKTNSASAPLPTETDAPIMTEPAAIQPGQLDVDYSASVYLDDLSNPTTLLLSMANAFNRHEFIRAYSYWSNPLDYLGSLEGFSNNYSSLVSMQITIGSISSDGAAGSVYYTAPTVIKITNDNDSMARVAACFILRFPQPANFAVPPIDPLHIEQSQLVVYDDSLSDSEIMAKACDGMNNGSAGQGNAELQQIEDLTDLGPNNYIDNRSGALEVVSSYFNAINRKEYVRAFSYWQENGNFQVFANGFSDTDLITTNFGDVVSDAGAGQWFYTIPVAQVVQTTSGDTQTFVGCMTLHLSNPAFQATLPFEPMGIKESHFSLVSNGSDLVPLLAAACD